VTFDQYIEEAKSFLLKCAVNKVFEVLISKFTFLAWGPLGPLVKYILGKVLKIAIYESEMAVFFLYTDIRVNAQGRKFYRDIEANLTAQNGEDEEAKKNAEQNLIDSFRNLVKLTS